MVTLALDGVPEAEIRMGPAELAGADPARMIVRLENRLHGLETVRARAISEIGRLELEAGRAGEDLARPLSLAEQLAEAQDRVRRIEQELQEAARASPHGDKGGSSATEAGDGERFRADISPDEGHRAGGEESPAVVIARRDHPASGRGINPVTAPVAAGRKPPQPAARARLMR